MNNSASVSRKSLSVFTLIVVLLTLVLPTRLWAGSAASEEALFEPEAIAAFAKDVERYAAAKGARVFLIARQGRPSNELPEGIQFTHTAIAVYSSIELDDGSTRKGYAIHNLYQKAGKAEQSELIVDYPVDFFWSAKSLRAGIVIPSSPLQHALLELIALEKDKQLHNPHYSAIANPHNALLQNCTEYTLDLINAAIYGTTDIRQLKANAAAHFKAIEIKESPLKIALGSLVKSDISLRDHDGPVATATFTTIARYLDENQLNKHAVTLDHEGHISSLL